MSKVQKDFEKLLNDKLGKDIINPIFTKKIASKLLNRINNIQLYAHSYAFTLHFRNAIYDAIDLLNFAHQQNLSGIDIHLAFGEEKSLNKKNLSDLKEVKKLARKLNLKIVLEISSTIKSKIQKVVEIAKILGVQKIRVYNRHDGYLLDSIHKCTVDLKYACKIADKNDLYFVIEAHEVLNSSELVHIVEKIDSPRLRLLFDFGNMINANEKPLQALKIMSPYISHVHIKDVIVISMKNGYAHQGVVDGKGDLPQLRMLYELLMLGGKNPQVKIFALEQVNGYYAPLYRFKGEHKNPRIPKRDPSYTKTDLKLSLNESLRIEKKNAIHQVKYIKKLLNDFRKICERRLDS